MSSRRRRISSGELVHDVSAHFICSDFGAHRRRACSRSGIRGRLEHALGAAAPADSPVDRRAYVTATVTVGDEDARAADEKLRLVEKVIQGRDFTCIAESVNAVEAWLGSLPGHVYANVRQPPVSTLNLAHMMPLSA